MSIICIERLRKEYSTLVAVNDINYTIEPGQVVGLIGPNGAGKTTLLRMLATVLPPTDGTASICGFDLRKEPLEVRKKIGYLPDFFNLYNDLTLTECLTFFAQAYKIPPTDIPHKVRQSLDYVDLSSKKDSFVRHLSRGMIQRMGLAVLLVRDPEIFLLDEPASGLDPIARIQLRDILRKLSEDGKTILISSHILTELSGFCSHIAIMNRGQLVLEGNIQHIERQIAGSGTVTIKVLSDTERAKALIEQFPGVSLEKARNDTFTVIVPEGASTIAQLNAHLVHHDISVVHISEQQATLEELFVEISREKQLQAS